MLLEGPKFEYTRKCKKKQKKTLEVSRDQPVRLGIDPQSISKRAMKTQSDVAQVTYSISW